MFWTTITTEKQKEEILEFLKNSKISLKDFKATLDFLSHVANSPEE